MIFVWVVLGLVALSGVVVLREWRWLRRVERASGDPVALERLFNRKRWRW